MSSWISVGQWRSRNLPWETIVAFKEAVWILCLSLECWQQIYRAVCSVVIAFVTRFKVNLKFVIDRKDNGNIWQPIIHRTNSAHFALTRLNFTAPCCQAINNCNSSGQNDVKSSLQVLTQSGGGSKGPGHKLNALWSQGHHLLSVVSFNAIEKSNV